MSFSSGRGQRRGLRRNPPPCLGACGPFPSRGAAEPERLDTTHHRARPGPEMGSPAGGPERAGPAADEGLSLAALHAHVDLCLGCSRCTQRLNESTYLLRSGVEHDCPHEILLARSKREADRKTWRRVGRRPSFPRPARYAVCRYYSPGRGCRHHHNQCTFARSPEEALVWTFERGHGVSRLRLKFAVQSSGAGAPGSPPSPAATIRAEFGGRFQLLCSGCFRRRPPRLCPVDAGGRCPEHGACRPLMAHVSTGHSKQQFVEVRPQPNRRHPLAYCRFVARGRPCRHGAAYCQYAHSDVEMAVWKAEQQSGLQRRDLLSPHDPEGSGSTVPLGQTPKLQLYCRACLLTCCSQEAFENHCASPEHARMVAFDPAVPWEHRAPPMGLSRFQLCPSPDICEYGDACTKAHSAQELQEWVQRAQAVELRKQEAWQEGLVSYQARLLDEYQRSSSEVLVLAETVDGVSVSCDQLLVREAKGRTAQHCWTFDIHSEDPLLHVALLKLELGADFSLVTRGPRHPGQLYAEGEHFRVPGSPAHFQVAVHVQGASFGTFEQWVVFDFGRRPALLRKLGLRLGRVCGPGLPGDPAPTPPQELERWHTGNRQVVPSVERTAEQAALMAKYKTPALALEFSPSGRVHGPLTCANYRQRMHQFLYEEEAARQRLVAKLNLRAQVSLKTVLQTPAVGLLLAPSGSLYAEVTLPTSLMPDTDQGFLLGRAVSTALVAPVPAPDDTVFEARLEARASSQQVLWLLLSAHCCAALGLQPETSPVLEIQFQVDPLTFRLWHQAVDELPEAQLVLPHLPACAPPCPRPVPAALRGNRKQKLAMALISGGPGGPKPIPPLLIYGPFGTGKTYTLAMASLEVTRQPHTKVLICTHTNSAADIYIREYFHGHVSSGHPEATPLRVMYTDRPPSQTDAATLRYCCLTEDGRAFRPPTRTELQRHCIVVTTTSQACELRVPAGFFSHILIDEAAQMLECEALTPLRYATPHTRIVLAGDHLQVTPKLFSVAGSQAASHTLLNRLFLHYQQETHAVSRQSRVVFHENYRSTQALVAFASRHFYLAQGNPIHASGRIPRHPQHYPLMFCHVAGTPERDMSQTSWLNPAEILQVVEKVREVYDTWPPCWGGREQQHICVVSHGAQVGALRQELRRKNLAEVSVGSFEILPGREFRVVVLSTIHTCDSLRGPGVTSMEFFMEARVLNTIMTRAQSQVVAVGDAVALCSFGACSRLWKSFIRECVEHGSVCPQGLSLEQIEQGVAQVQRWPPGGRPAAALGAERAGAAPENTATGEPPLERATAKEGAATPETTAAGEERTVAGDAAAGATATGPVAGGSPAAEEAATVKVEAGATADGETVLEDPEDSGSDFWPLDGELNADDSILKELLDESRNVTVTVREDGLLDTVAGPTLAHQAHQYVNLPPAKLRRLLRAEPETYRRCTFLRETFERATAVALDGAGPGTFQVKGRLNCGMAFTGDEVLVQVLHKAGDDEVPVGRPQGRVLGVLKRCRRELVFVCRMDTWDPRIMVPIDNSVTKIFVAELKDPQLVPIHRLLRGRVQHVGHERLLGAARHTRLFRVRIVLWRERFYYPLGIVLEVLPETTTWDRCLRVLDLEYGLQEPSPDPAAIAKVLQRYRLELSRAPGQREDCRGFLTFTVDPQGACNLDDALSVRDLGPQYEVAVHIADVATLLPRDSALDVEARRQGTAFYAPDREPVPMLPASLCQDAFSLLPGQDRLAISLFLTIEKSSGQLSGQRFAPSVVRSTCQLSYEEAEQMIRSHPGADQELPPCLDSVDACVVAAFHFSQTLRQCRLGGDCHYEQPSEDSVLGFRAAHTMVKEYMVQFNSSVAEFLVGSDQTQTVTPLRWQPAPSSTQLDTLSKKHCGLVPLSLHLRQHLHGHTLPNTRLCLLASLWRQLQLAAQAQDFGQMVDLITTDDLHPSLAPACFELCKALGRSAFGRSSLGEQQPAAHHSLQVSWYAWASSPIRRYMDVVLQRQVLLVLGLGGPTYSAKDIDGLCRDFGRQHARAQSYQRRAYSLRLASHLQAQPRDKLGLAVDVEAGARCFRVLFPADRESLPEPCPVHHRGLQLAEPPRPLEGLPGLLLRWRRRIYSVLDDGHCAPRPGTLLDQHTQPMDPVLWRRLLELVEQQRWPEAATLVREQGAKESQPRELGWVARSPCGHFVEVVRELGRGDVLQVQLGASLQRGILVPALQVWTAAPGLSLCLEHVEKPGNCFSGCVPQPAPDRFANLDEYAGVWGPFCALESATSAVAENDSITLQQVGICWDKERTPRGQLQGTFCLDAAFLHKHSIDVSFGYCYLCIQLGGLPAPPNAGEPPTSLGPHLSIDPNTYTWVAHGLTKERDVEEGPAGQREAPGQVHFYVHHITTEKVPEEVLRPGTLFTIEVLPKQLPDLRKEEAVHKLKEASPLVVSIALGLPIPRPPHRPPRHPPGQQPHHRVAPSSLLKRQTYDIPGGRHKLNPSQTGAVREALRKQFTVIQGPPGTGKTVVGLHIVFWFHKSNQALVPAGNRQSVPCILYCGPSNKSVDVLAGMLQSWREELKPLRVYSEQAEATEFPGPSLGSKSLPRKTPREGKPNRNLRNITLHHRIRQAPNPHAEALRAFDSRVQEGNIFSEEDVTVYKSTLKKARQFELSQHTVILCTCSCAASVSLRKLNIRQVLVDEAGMATEPETLIPLVHFSKAEKVVLLGDHKQLRPVVKSEHLQNLGLERSLFERYHADAYLLDTQYRMHKDICAFPSTEFYKRKLKTWQGLRRPPSILGHADRESCTVIFGHLQGCEQSLLVSTDEGNENSKANLEEAVEVVRIAKQLTLDRTVNPKDIAILTPYNAQVAEITKRLLQEGVTGVTVSSITKSQGSEWRYVLVSTVRTCPEGEIDQRPTKSWLKKFLGFVVDPNQVNVAITRAQEGLCLIGSSGPGKQTSLSGCKPTCLCLKSHRRVSAGAVLCLRERWASPCHVLQAPINFYIPALVPLRLHCD
ncbi:LOW QUALITY PROTEIN: helicase with zinc finger domain 2 [Trichechus manatus latirostris]|uniref:LOW QUALITY PROTEIN: helicase with zinc finger domain 2 n=1 Tax=Trichechus manatus latirostris TaxID=127582 RepID=A0A2Y9RTX0_TRIMA|nr:LOW QUALITY PROTEIN: helicase with zinc finger domain 2 [Trichechus manatus latirostris]